MRKFTLLLTLLCSIVVYSQEKINWLNFEEAMELNKTTPRPIMIDMYTSWCGWCKKMDATTFSDSAIIAYVNKNFYAVKFDAETKAEIRYKDSVYTNNNIGKLDANGRPVRSKSHSLAQLLMGGRMSYPTVVYMVTEKNIIAPVPGYLSPENIEPVLLYFGEGIYNLNLFDAFSTGLKSKGILK